MTSATSVLIPFLLLYFISTYQRKKYYIIYVNGTRSATVVYYISKPLPICQPAPSPQSTLTRKMVIEHLWQ